MKTILTQNAFVLSCLIGVQAIYLWSGCQSTSPTPDEPAHLLAGISYWQNGRADLYNVNPPLVKLWATLPLVAAKTFDLQEFGSFTWVDTELRQEFFFGSRFVSSEGERFQEHLQLARRMCAVFAIIGTLAVYELARILIGCRAGLLAALIWAFNPNVLGHGCLLGCDIPGAVMGTCWVLAAILGLRNPTLWTLSWTGIWMGLAVITKFTLLIAIPMWAIAVGVKWWFDDKVNKPQLKKWSRLCTRPFEKVLWVWFVAWVIVCAGYRFQQMFKPLGQFKFESQLLRGSGENRFRLSILHSLPTPLPAAMISGLDHQWEDFDKPRISYLNGTWKHGGWIYYYIFVLLYKLPIGTMILILIGIWVERKNRMLLAVTIGLIAAFLALVSLKSNMNEHGRYVWGVIPFLTVLASAAANIPKAPSKLLFVGFCSVWSVAAGVTTFPCGVNYGNELVGTPRNTWRVLAASNIDWSTDWLKAKRWLQESDDPEVVALYGRWSTSIRAVGINVTSDLPNTVQQRIANGEVVRVKLLLPVDGRLTLQRTEGASLIQSWTQAEKVGCCTEVYLAPLSDVMSLRDIVWVDPQHPFLW